MNTIALVLAVALPSLVYWYGECRAHGWPDLALGFGALAAVSMILLGFVLTDGVPV